MGLIDEDHVYSFSQLNGFDECPYAFYLERLEKDEDGNPLKKLSNSFAEQGSLIHDIIDRWAKGIITKEEMTEEYERRYFDEVVTSLPRMLASKGYGDKTYNQGLDYLSNFDEFSGFKVISTEEEFLIDLKLSDGRTRKFKGFIDMILENETDGSLVICDHKSKSLTSFKKVRREMYRQQYMYATAVYEKTGKWPSTLMFNLFKENLIDTEKFSEKEYEETIKWATECIDKIESYEIFDWLRQKEKPDFFCAEICSMRNECSYGGRSYYEMSKRKKQE